MSLVLLIVLPFLSTPSGWRATKAPGCAGDHGRISIHALRVEGDRAGQQLLNEFVISIHALRVEGDSSRSRPRLCASYFYPRPPGGGRPAKFEDCEPIYKIISIHALRVEGDLCEACHNKMHPEISIHALRVEGDICAATLSHE